MRGSRHAALKRLTKAMAIVGEAIRNPVCKGMVASLYTPDSRVDSLVSRVKKLAGSVRSVKQRQKLGYALEDLCLIAFSGLAGFNTIKSYQSVAPQIDLLINGSDTEWQQICKMIRVCDGARGIFVEAKARRGKIGDPDLERICGILQVHLLNTTALGVLVSLSGVTGTSVRAVSDASLTQQLFYAHTGKPIIVLELHDLDRLLDQVVLFGSWRRRFELWRRRSPSSRVGRGRAKSSFRLG